MHGSDGDDEKRLSMSSQSAREHYLILFNMKVLYVNNIVSICLILINMAVLHTVIIDSSVLSAIGLLFLYSCVEKIHEAIKAGKKLKIQKGDFSAEVSAGVD
mgnify:CR=1 FL=1